MARGIAIEMKPKQKSCRQQYNNGITVDLPVFYSALAFSLFLLIKAVHNDLKSDGAFILKVLYRLTMITVASSFKK